jgi:hypothetical protein
MIVTNKICNSTKLSNTHFHTPVADIDWFRSSYGYPEERSLVTEAPLDGRNATYGESTPLELIKLSNNLFMLLFNKVTPSLQAFTFDPRLARLDSELRQSIRVGSRYHSNGLPKKHTQLVSVPQVIWQDGRVCVRTLTWPPPAPLPTR